LGPTPGSANRFDLSDPAIESSLMVSGAEKVAPPSVLSETSMR
jgi:hypothetical protein